MALFKHKENIPELPVAPSLPSIPKMRLKNNINELPRLPPSNSQKDDFGEEMVKSAISDHNIPEVNEVTGGEMERNSPHIFPTATPQPVVAERKTIFVKVEKYHALEGALSEIQEQIKTLSKQVQTLKDVKARQVQEINVWDEEMKKINQRLSKIDSGIFGDV